MIFQVMMKDPDGVDHCIKEAFNDATFGSPSDEFNDSVWEELQAAKRKWFKWSEYLTVEIDTEAGTCVVIEK